MDRLRELIELIQDELGTELISDMKARDLEARLRAHIGGEELGYISKASPEEKAQRNEAIAGAVRQGVQPVELAQRFNLHRGHAWRLWRKFKLKE